MNAKTRTVVLPLLAALIWGMAFVAQKQNNMGAFTFNAARAVVAFVFLLPVVWLFRRCPFRNILREEKREKTGKMWLGGTLSGVTLSFATYFQQRGMDLGTDAGKAAFITALYIVLVPVAGLFFGKKSGIRVWIAAALAVAALYLLCVKGDFTVEGSDLTVFFAPFLFCAQIMVVDHFSADTDPIRLSCVQFLTSFIVSAAGAVIMGEQISASAIRDSLLPVLYLGIFSSGIAYTLQNLAQKGSNPAVVSILLGMESVFSLLFGTLFLHERMEARQYIGCAIMLCAVIAVQLEMPKGGSKKDPKEKAER